MKGFSRKLSGASGQHPLYPSQRKIDLSGFEVITKAQ